MLGKGRLMFMQLFELLFESDAFPLKPVQGFGQLSRTGWQQGLGRGYDLARQAQAARDGESIALPMVCGLSRYSGVRFSGSKSTAAASNPGRE